MKYAYLLFIVLVLATPATGAEVTPAALLDEVERTVDQNFYDPQKLDTGWKRRVAEARRRIASAADLDAARAVLQDLLASLKTSHTAIYGPSDPFYYFLASTFGRAARGYDRVFGREGVRMPDAGFLVVATREGTFVQSVLEGGPADRAGVRAGDRVVSVAGGPWRGVEPFRVKEGTAVPLQVQSERGGRLRTVSLVPRRINPQDAFLQASRASVRTIDLAGKKVGYYHVWAFTDTRIYGQFDDLLHDELRGIDALVLDLRDGIGGSFPDLLYPFLPGIPRVEFTDRNGRKSTAGGPWTRPVIVLINERARSSKELYAHAFATLPFVTLVGTHTAGAVTAGRTWFMQDGSLLYVAVARVLVEGKVLEGKGVDPDVAVERPIPYSQGKDPQLERGLQILSEKLSR